jgi:hypothetical protein
MPETVLLYNCHIQLDTYNFSVIPELNQEKILFCFLVKDTSGNLYIDEGTC